MENLDIRWKQRFQNFEKSIRVLEQALEISHPDVVQKAGIIQLFEVSFELGWKVMKDFSEFSGFMDIRSPRESIKKAFEMELITDGQIWLEALENRNVSSHAYDEEKINLILVDIRTRYITLLRNLIKVLKNKL